jgi:low temperature requirement protein LtrA
MTSHDAQSQGANPSNRGTLATPAAVDDLPPRPVTALELFFDLVFVFTITRLTELLDHDLHPRGIAQLLLIFGVSYWT